MSYDMETKRKRRPRTPTSFKLSDEGKRILLALEEKLAITKIGILELAIRELGRRESVYPEAK